MILVTVTVSVSVAAPVDLPVIPNRSIGVNDDPDDMPTSLCSKSLAVHVRRNYYAAVHRHYHHDIILSSKLLM